MSLSASSAKRSILLSKRNSLKHLSGKFTEYKNPLRADVLFKIGYNIIRDKGGDSNVKGYGYSKIFYKQRY